MRFVTLAALLFLGSYALGAPKSTTERCKQDENCFLPDCNCASLTNPGGFARDLVPQFVVLSFDDAVTISNFPFYEEFKTFYNPNGCRITMSFFVSHTYTNYSLVNELHRLGHEIALHSITHKSDVENYWRPANKSVWMSEMSDLKKIIEYNAKIPPEDIKGWRAPFLEVGGDEMFSAMHELGLEYDSSWPTLKYTDWYGDSPIGSLWPYTLDYPSIQDCQLGRCPKDTYDGLWVAPMVDLNDNVGEACAMVDTCRSIDYELYNSTDAIFTFLQRNFNNHYHNERAPFGLYAHHSWFYENDLANVTARKEGYKRFLRWVENLPDVYVVSMDRVLGWMKNPVDITGMPTHAAFRCPTFDPVSTCPDASNYEYNEDLPADLNHVIMSSCARPKPPTFPWLGNPYGNATI